MLCYLIYAVTNLAPPVLSALETVFMALEVRKGLHDFFLGVEDEGAVLHDGLIQRGAGDDDLRQLLVPMCKTALKDDSVFRG